MTSRRPLVLELGGNTILFRLLTKPSFCSFPLLDDREAHNGAICFEREEVFREHEELNKIILFLQCPAGGEVVRASAPTGALPKIVTETRGRAYGPLVMKAAAHRTRREDASRAQALSHILTEATATTGPPAPTCTGAPNYQLMPAMGILRKTHMTR